MPSPDAQYKEYNPSLVLKPFVARFIQGWTINDLPHKLTIPPSGGIFLSYVFGAPINIHFKNRVNKDRPRLFIGGQLRKESPVLEPQGKFGLLGTEFTPTGFYKLFHENASRFTDDAVDFGEVIPRDHDRLLDQLSNASEVTDYIQIIDRYLTKKIPEALDVAKVDKAVTKLQRSNGMISVGELADHCSLSSRHLRRKFLTAVGVSPKYFSKIVQFNAVISSMQQNDQERLHHLALECGYFDQAHFIRDFNKFVGQNPLQFLQNNDQFLRTYLGKK